MPAFRTILNTAAPALVIPGRLAAQDLAPPAPKSAVSAPFVVTPMPARLAAPSAPAAAAAELLGEARTPTVARAARGQSSTLMIVGGAAIVTGLLLDEGVITLVGACVWLSGLYLYLR